jgi:glycosyltransferase involved in cell wall biosynthesis
MTTVGERRARSRDIPGRGPEPMPFSLLMAVYAGDRPDFVRRAFCSSVHEQLRRPDEVVLVQDGPVSPELEATLVGLCAGAPVPVTRVHLTDNCGLASAMQAGLAACRYDVVARMDADDVSLPGRFAVQLPEVEAGADLVGAALLEIGEDEHDVRGERIPPTTPALIARTARLHDPFNHPTVVYRRSAVAAAGGYEHLALMEDYWLFVRMIASGAKVANCAQPLVMYRVATGAYDRRGGLDLLRSELALQARFLRSGFVTRREYLRNVTVRGLYRLVPTAVRRPAYRLIVATRGARLERGRARATL